MYSGKELEIFNRVVQVVCSKIERKGNPLTPKQVKPDSDFIKDLGADSLTVVELVIGIEDEFEIEEIPEESVEKIRFVSDVVEYLSKSVA